jgi:hypothetical protein
MWHPFAVHHNRSLQPTYASWSAEFQRYEP